MIEELTKEQEAMCPHYVDKWLAIGLSTEEVKIEEVKPFMDAAYKQARLKPPEYLLFDSPYAAAKAIAERTGKKPDDHINEMGYGSQDAGWLSFYDFFREVCGIDLHEIEPLNGIAKTCGWYAPYDEVCFLQQRPKAIHFDDKERLHNDSGMAVEYRDGWGAWSIEGVRVNEQIVMRPETQTLEQLNQEKNEEIRRIRIERYGMDKYLAEMNATCIDSRDNAIEGTKEKLMKCEGMTVLLTHCPSTGKIFPMQVDGNIKTCKEAQDWLWGINDSDTRIIGRT